MADFRVTLASGLAVERGSWDGSAAERRVFAWATDADGVLDYGKAARAYLIADPSTKRKGDLHMPVADVRDGKLVLVSNGLAAALSRLGQDFPLEVPEAVRKQAAERATKELDVLREREAAAVARADASPNSIFVMLRVPAKLAAEFPGTAEEPHITLAYLGDGSAADWEKVALIVADEVASRYSWLGISPVEGLPPRGLGSESAEHVDVSIGGLAYFDLPERRVAYSVALVPEPLDLTRQRIIDRVSAALDRDIDSAWSPHATLAYLEPGKVYAGPQPSGTWRVEYLEVWQGPDRRMVIGACPETRRRVWKLEREGGRWTASRNGGKQDVGTFDSLDLAMAELDAAETRAVLQDRWDSRKAPAVHTPARNFTTVLRRDSLELAPPQRMDNGWLRCDALLARAGNVQRYVEGGMEVLEWRDANGVLRPESYSTALGIPWELLHSPDLLTPASVRGVARGCVIECAPTPDKSHLGGTLIAWDGELADALSTGTPEHGVCRDLSMAYLATIDPRPGTADDGTAFHRRAVDFLYNSVASCPEGRAGTARVGDPRSDARGITVARADALLEIARSGKAPSNIYFDRAQWKHADACGPNHPKKDTDTMNLDKMLAAAGKSMADLAAAMKVSEADLATMLAAELTDDQAKMLAAAIGALMMPAGAKVEVEVEDMGKKPMPIPGQDMDGMVKIAVKGTEHEVEKAVADYIRELEGATASAAARSDSADKARIKAEGEAAAAKTEAGKLLSHADAERMAMDRAEPLARTIALAQQVLGIDYKPAARKDAAGVESPLSERDWQRAALIAVHGDDKGNALVAKIDKANAVAQAELYAHHLDEARELVLERASKVPELRANLAKAGAQARQKQDSADAEAQAEAAVRAAQDAALGRGTSPTTH